MSIETTTASTSNVVAAFSNTMADAVERITPAVVLVNGRPRQPGSGIVFASNLVLTADHVLEREDDLSVQTHDGRTLAATFVGRDPATDLAVLQVADLNITPANIASAPARVGQLVLAVGRPGGEGVMASLGVVSVVGGPLSLGRGATLERYIQTDATPYPGFSGGPLIDPEGAIVGVTTTGLVNRVALGIPAALALRVAETLAQHGFIKRGFLGVSSQPVQLPSSQRAGRSQENGLLLVRVEEGSPAYKGGLLVGDILVALDGQEVSDTDDLQALLTGNRVGATVPVLVIRGDSLKELQITVGQRS